MYLAHGGFSLFTKDGQRNLRRYRAALDYSLDQIQLEEVWQRVHRNNRFAVRIGRKRYSDAVIVVTFKYAVCEYNRCGSNRYVKLGVDSRQLELENCVMVRDGELCAIQLNEPVTTPLPPETLEPYFCFSNGQYVLKKNPRKVITPAKLRELMYEDGFVCNGTQYRRWKRSAGSARVGKVLFIDEALYPAMHRWEMCGLRVHENDEIDLAALESYISLTTSSIIDTLELDPKNILVIDDFDSTFKDRVVSVEEEDGQLTAQVRTLNISNCIWDGQGLIDQSAMGTYADKGMVLLRSRFFKCCCFNTNLQQWFRDNGITDVSQLNGKTNATRIEDIKLVTTPSSIKFLKFGSLKKWRDHVGTTFGVVKHDKKTHFFDGRMVQTHYQLLNTLQMTPDEVRTLVRPMFEYLRAIETDPAVLRYYLKHPGDSVDRRLSMGYTRNDIVFKLLGINDKFCRTKVYLDFIHDMMKSQVKHLRLGHVLVNGNYSTLFGNPFEMLLATIGKFDGVSTMQVGSVHSTRFPYGTRLCGSRSPHVTMSNVWTPINLEHPAIDRYFNLTPEIVCVNTIGENTLNRLSGADFDSDTVLLTDNKTIVQAALKNDGLFPIAVDRVEAKKIKRKYCAAQQAELDNKTSNNLIGDIINCSQELNTMIWNRLNNGDTLKGVFDIYLDVCKLNAAQTIEIDSAKREFNIDNAKELDILRKKYCRLDETDRKIKPAFFAAKDRGKGYYNAKVKNYAYHDTTMDYLQREVNRFQRRHKKRGIVPLPFAVVVKRGLVSTGSSSQSRIDKILGLVWNDIIEEGEIWNSDASDDTKAMMAHERRMECAETIGNMRIGKSTMYGLLLAVDKDENRRVARRLLDILFGYPNSSFYELIDNSKEVIYTLEEDPEGDVKLLDFCFKKVQK